MARSTFGGTTDDSVEATKTIAGQKVSSPQADITVTFWSARTGGTQYTDLLDGNGNPATSITSDANGLLPEFSGPDGIVSMWADAGAGRVKIVTNNGASDDGIANYVTNPASATGSALAATYAALADLVPAPTAGGAASFKRDTLTAAADGDLVITLGATPATDSLDVIVSTGGVAGVLLSSGYTLTDNSLTVPSLTTGDVVETRYAYDPADYPDGPGDASTGPVTLLSDQFNRTASATSMGDADTGQTWEVLRGTWGIASGTSAYLATPSSASSTTNDAATVTLDLTGKHTLTIEYRILATSTSNGPGIAMFMADADNGIITNNTGFFTRTTASLTVRADTWSQTMAAGDTGRIVIDLDASTYAMYRDAGTTGSFVSINTPVAIAQRSGNKFGLRERSINTARWDWITMVAA